MADTSAATILDYSSSHYIPIQDGDVVIFSDFETLAHITNLTSFGELVEETGRLVDLFPKSHMRKLLEADLDQIVKMMDSLAIHHRQSRSINLIGKALKYIAGTPDYDDFNEVRGKQDELISANNRQVVINTELQSQINNLTNTVNVLLKNTRTSEIDSGHLYDLLLTRNRAIIRELDSIALSVVLSKIQLINPVLLDSREINFMLKSENYSSVSISEIIVNSKLKVVQDKDVIIFLIKFPVIKLLCKKQIIYPVVHRATVLLFETNSVAKCENAYLMLQSCKRKSITSFCQLLVNGDNTCLRGLMNNYTASCKTTSAHATPYLVAVDDGITIINDQPSTITIHGENRTLVRGTYLITF